MDIYFLHNSGFAMFFEKSLVIFDYHKNLTFSPVKNASTGVISKEDLCARDKVYVFSSHIHPDHFNPVILDWQSHNPNTSYFLDEAMQKNVLEKETKQVTLMKKGDKADDGYIKVQAFGSTDIGVSFYAEVEGVKIFHAGDLNLWHWSEASTAEEVEEARKAFYLEMADIEKTIHPDIAFFPVDAVMGHDYDEGAQYFIQSVKPKVFIPMHCRTGFDHLEDFKKRSENENTRILIYDKRGEQIQ